MFEGIFQIINSHNSRGNQKRKLYSPQKKDSAQEKSICDRLPSSCNLTLHGRPHLQSYVRSWNMILVTDEQM